MKNKHELREEYAKFGIDFVYNDRTHESFLKILGAPTFVEGVDSAQMTGFYRVSGGIKQAQDVEVLSERARDLYRQYYSENLIMLKYLDNIGSSNDELNNYSDVTLSAELNGEQTIGMDFKKAVDVYNVIDCYEKVPTKNDSLNAQIQTAEAKTTRDVCSTKKYVPER